MRSRPIVLGSVLAALVLPTGAEASVGSTYKVGNCGADTDSYNTRAFASFATRGMEIRRACYPHEDPEPRGLITGNVVRKGKTVERGAMSLVHMTAPPGTQFVHVNWGGHAQRVDCRYAVQVWAESSDGTKIDSFANRRANRGCPRRRHRQLFGPSIKPYPIPGATRIVQRVLCVGRNGSGCSAGRANYINTTFAEVTIEDVAAPTATILPDTPLARGEWVGGTQPLRYDASDNVGVQRAEAISGGKGGGEDRRPCTFATLRQVYADPVPCPSGPGQINPDTSLFAEGTQSLVVRAYDPAGRVGDSAPVTARIDNSSPGRVDVGVEGGDQWRNRNDFSLVWANPPEVDRAPIAGVTYQLCAAPESCSRASQAGTDMSRFAIQVPEPGAWTLSLWRRDAAGNETDTAASVPVTLRFDPEPPQLGFEPPPAEDPTLISVPVTDTVSGPAGGAIEISASGSGVWQALPTQQDGQRLLARIDDAALPAGGYQLRARAVDHAGNEASTDRRVDGEPMALTLPLRLGAHMRAGFERTRTVRQRAKQKGTKRRVRVLRRAVRLRPGREAQVAGRLVNRDGDGIPGAEIRVLSGSATSPEEIVAVLQTDSAGRYRYSAAGSSSRTLRFVYSGSPLVLPAERTIRMTVPARSSLHVNRRRVLNGQAVRFTGRLRTQPPPAGGKLVELQARLSDRWQTFRTTRTNEVGRWAVPYRFKRTRGVQRFGFRVRLPEEAGYPFAAGGSRPIVVRVRGV